MVSPFSFTQVYNNFSLKGGDQGKAKKTRKFAQVKRVLNPNDARLYVLMLSTDSIALLKRFTRKENQLKQKKKEEEEREKALKRV